jgi:hypothetical protein
MTNLDTKLKLVHLSNANNLDVDIRVELAGVDRVANEAHHLQLK